MKAKELRATIRAHKGPILCGVILKDDVIYVQVVKSDLLRQIEKITDNQAYVQQDGNCLFFHNCGGY